MNKTPAMVRVAVREAPVFAAAVMVTEPAPVPLVGDSVIQSTGLDAVHAQSGVEGVKVTLEEPPCGGNVSDVGVNVYEQVLIPMRNASVFPRDVLRRAPPNESNRGPVV